MSNMLSTFLGLFARRKKKAYTKGRGVHINLVLALVEHVKGRYNTGALAPIRRAQGATC